VVQANRKGAKAEKYVEATLELIRERGGSYGVTLREVSKRLGYAHTNAYNYFTDFQDLLWATLRRALIIYAEAIADGLTPAMRPAEYLERMLANYVGYGSKDPGLYRFISSDPLDPEKIPSDIIEAVVGMKTFSVDVVDTACGNAASADAALEIANILISYLDGEALALINGRTLPGEDIAGRAVGNAMRIVQLMTARNHDGADLSAVEQTSAYPVLGVQSMAETMGIDFGSSEAHEGGAA